MRHFGNARLVRPDVRALERIYYRLFGLADPSHYLRSRYFIRACQHLRPRTILDAGCGAGDYAFAMARHWPDATITAVDVDAALLGRTRQVQDRIRGAERIDFVCQDITALKARAAYDLIVCIDALEHVADQAQVLRNFRQALTSGGSLYLHIPLARPRPVPFSAHLHSMHEWSEHEHIAPMRTHSELVAMLREAGLSVVHAHPTFGRATGELACSLFALFHAPTRLNLLAQGLLSPVARALALAELATHRATGYALSVIARSTN